MKKNRDYFSDLTPETEITLHHFVDVQEGIFVAHEAFSWDDPRKGEIRFTERHEFATIGLPELSYFVRARVQRYSDIQQLRVPIQRKIDLWSSDDFGSAA